VETLLDCVAYRVNGAKFAKPYQFYLHCCTVQYSTKTFGGQCYSFWIFISNTGTIWRLMRSRFTYNSLLGVCLWFVGWMWASSLDALELY
jgi:hypothetical protein